MNKFTYRLGDVVNFYNGRAYLMPELQDKGKYRIIRVGNFSGKDEWFYSDMELEESKYCEKGDLLYKWACNFGPEIWNGEKAIYHYHIWKLIVDSKKLDKKFLYYLLQFMTPYWLSSTNGSTMVHITKGIIEDKCISIPKELFEQEKISSLLSNIDSKIDNNNKIISELESMAKTIYDYWFLQFEFPNGDGKPYKSSGGKMAWNEELKREIPEGWSIKKLSDVVEVIDNRGKNPPTASSNTRFPIIDVATLRKRGRCISYIDIKNYVTEDVYQTWFRAGHPQKGDILFSTVGSLAETKLFYPNRCYDGVIAQNIVGFRNKDIYSYLYQMINSEKKQIIGLKIGSVQPSLKVGHVLEHKFLYPNNNILNKYCDMLEPINGYINKLNQENQELTSLRDFLLPMLMNGQVTFKEEA